MYMAITCIKVILISLSPQPNTFLWSSMLELANSQWNLAHNISDESICNCDMTGRWPGRWDGMVVTFHLRYWAHQELYKTSINWRCTLMRWRLRLNRKPKQDLNCSKYIVHGSKNGLFLYNLLTLELIVIDEKTFRSVSYGPCSRTGVTCVASDIWVREQGP